MTDLESELRTESAALAGGRDPLAGYRFVTFGPEGESSWYNPVTRHTLWRDPDGSVVDPQTLRPVNYVAVAGLDHHQKDRDSER